MTVELDNVVKNLKGGNLTIELEDEDGIVSMYIEGEGDSGASYQVQSVQDIAEFVQHYLMNYYADELDED